MDFATLNKSGKKYWLLALILVVIAAGFLAWRTTAGQSGQSDYQTVAAQKGTLISNVEATGLVRSAQSVELTWNAGGRVQDVGVSMGDRVSAHQVLASLDLNTAPRNVILAQSDLIIARQNLDSLENSTSTTARAMKSLADANQAVKDAQDRYDYLTRKRVSDELLKDLNDQISQVEDQIKRTEWLYNRFYAHLAEGNPKKAQMIVNLTRLRDNLKNLRARYNWFTSSASEIEIARSLAALNLAKARQQDAQRELDRQSGGTNPDDIRAARAKVAAAQATLNLASIIAPFDGVITIDGPLPGDRVAAGQTAFRVDDLSRLMVDLQISEVDINSITADQPVTIQFDAIPDHEYTGRVASVDLAAKSDRGAVNFNVTVQITDADELVKPGMTASVVINTKQVENTLLVPNRAIRMVSDGQRIVYVLKDGQPTQVVIRLGTASQTETQVVGGDLKEGDLIILNPPVPTPGAPENNSQTP